MPVQRANGPIKAGAAQGAAPEVHQPVKVLQASEAHARWMLLQLMRLEDIMRLLSCLAT